IPATAGLHAEAQEYGARYTPRVPLDPAYPGQIGAYMGWTLPYYAEHFLTCWRGRLRPEMERNFERFDDYDTDAASLLDLAILLEDAIDMHDRHWQIHWVLNFAQFSATLALTAAIAKVRGEGDHSALMGRLQSSTENRNWDSIEALWKIKEWVKAEGGTVAKEFQRPTAHDLLRALAAPRVGRGRRGRGGGQGRGDGRRARRCGARRAGQGAGAEPADEPAHPRPPLLHRPGHQRPGPPGADGDRPQAGRRGRPDRPRGRHVPAVQRAARAAGGLAARRRRRACRGPGGGPGRRPS